MAIKDFIEAIQIGIKWAIAHFVKRVLVVIFCLLLIPMILISVTFELLSNFFESIHDLMENLFGSLYDFNKPFVIALFKSMGFHSGQVYLGNSFSREGILKLKEVANDNGIKCYIVEDMFREGDNYYVKVIVSKETDLNLLKLIFTTQDKTRY